MYFNLLKACVFSIGVINVAINSAIVYYVWNQDETNDCPVQSNIALASGAMMTTALSVSWYLIIRETRPSAVHPNAEELALNVAEHIGENIGRNFEEIGLTIQHSFADLASIGASRMESGQYSVPITHIDDNDSYGTGYQNYHPPRRIASRSPRMNLNMNANANTKNGQLQKRQRRHSLPPKFAGVSETPSTEIPDNFTVPNMSSENSKD